MESVTLARRLGTTAHLSALLMKATADNPTEVILALDRELDHEVLPEWPLRPT